MQKPRKPQYAPKAVYTLTLTRELKFKVNAVCVVESVFIFSGFSLSLPDIGDCALSQTNLTLKFFNKLNDKYYDLRFDNGEFNRL